MADVTLRELMERKIAELEQGFESEMRHNPPPYLRAYWDEQERIFSEPTTQHLKKGLASILDVEPDR